MLVPHLLLSAPNPKWHRSRDGAALPPAQLLQRSGCSPRFISPPHFPSEQKNPHGTRKAHKPTQRPDQEPETELSRSSSGLRMSSGRSQTCPNLPGTGDALSARQSLQRSKLVSAKSQFSVHWSPRGNLGALYPHLQTSAARALGGGGHTRAAEAVKSDETWVSFPRCSAG